MADKQIESFFPRELKSGETLRLESQDGFSYQIQVIDLYAGLFSVESDDPRIPMDDNQCIILGTDEGAITVDHDLLLIVKPLKRVRIRPITAIDLILIA